ncbi:MAG TPA: thioredoxin fold domain-containing protein [Candidatus Kapabacteria bacterium]|nr:thioredoxin fold domain-containing protein [Candidatus Kapabacteria bacterium]
MKKYFAASALVVVILAAAVYAYAEVHFKNASFKEAQALAAKEHKIIMVDLYTDWCGWCKRLDKDTYSTEEVGSYADANFISLKINAERGEGVTLAKNGKVQGYPTIIFYNEKGEEIHRLVGYQRPADFLATLKAAVAKGQSSN